jgi:mRNA-degrading endonuclease toxin of MazEF toxin-antitoxin module
VTRGEIHLVDLGPGVGREPAGPHPAVIVSNNTLNPVPWVISVVPGVDASTIPALRRVGVLVTAGESGLASDLVFLPYAIRALDPGRFHTALLGTVPAGRMRLIDAALRSTLML